MRYDTFITVAEPHVPAHAHVLEYSDIASQKVTVRKKELLVAGKQTWSSREEW